MNQKPLSQEYIARIKRYYMQCIISEGSKIFLFAIVFNALSLLQEYFIALNNYDNFLLGLYIKEKHFSEISAVMLDINKRKEICNIKQIIYMLMDNLFFII